MTCAQAVIAAVMAHSRETAPAGCCGVLLGSGQRIVEAVPARNRSDDLNRFEIDPHDHIAARRTARARRLEVVGFYHSHPHSPAIPSATDIAEATYDGCLYLIVSLVSDPAARLYRMNSSGPSEVQISVEPFRAASPHS